MNTNKKKVYILWLKTNNKKQEFTDWGNIMCKLYLCRHASISQILDDVCAWFTQKQSFLYNALSYT